MKVQWQVTTPAKKAPLGPQWAYEIKHDGYRLMVRKREDRVRIYMRRGADWTHRFRGLSDFNRLHSGGYDGQVFLYAFDLLELDGEDWRAKGLEHRKKRLAGLLYRPRDGILFNEHIEDDGELVFDHACRMGLEGIIAKRLDAPRPR